MRILIYKISFFLISVLAAQLFLSPFLPVPPKIRELNKCLEMGSDVIYLGDSTVFSSAKNDTDKRSISSMLQGLMPEAKICGITAGAYNLDIYLLFCEYIIKQKKHPKVIIMPVNMRSFSPEWDMRPEYQFEELKSFLSGNIFLKAFFVPASVFKYNFFEIKQKDFENSLVFDGAIPLGKVQDFDYKNYDSFTREGAEKIFSYDYMFSLKEDHRKARALVDIARVLNKSAIKVIFYITPVDYETGTEYLGRHFMDRMGANIRQIVSLLSGETSGALDLSTALNAGFFDYTFPHVCEHLNENGRRAVAEKIYERLVLVLKNRAG